MPSEYYQRVLEQDQELWPPVRWFSRAMSSWWTIALLAIPIVGYVYMAHYPIGKRYLWQHRLIDAAQIDVINFWPLQAACITLAVVILWSALRRLPMNGDSLGRFVTVIGLAIILVSQSWAFRYQTTGIAAVPVAEADIRQLDPLSLTYTTRVDDTKDRVLVVMIGGTQPIAVPLDGLPRWNDAAGDAMPELKLHDDPKLSPLLGFRARIKPTAYLADGKLEENEDGKQTATPTPTSNRNTTTLPYPANALLAITFEVEPEQGLAQTTTVWVPFEPEGTDSLVPKRFFQVKGMGSVGLSFRPKSEKLPFAMAASSPSIEKTRVQLGLHLADADSKGTLTRPGAILLSSDTSTSTTFRAEDPERGPTTYHLDWVYKAGFDSERALITASTNISNPFITAGIIAFLLGVALDFLMGWLESRPTKPKRITPTPQKSPAGD